MPTLQRSSESQISKFFCIWVTGFEHLAKWLAAEKSGFLSNACTLISEEHSHQLQSFSGRWATPIFCSQEQWTFCLGLVHWAIGRVLWRGFCSGHRTLSCVSPSDEFMFVFTVSAVLMYITHMSCYLLCWTCSCEIQDSSVPAEIKYLLFFPGWTSEQTIVRKGLNLALVDFWLYSRNRRITVKTVFSPRLWQAPTSSLMEMESCGHRLKMFLNELRELLHNRPQIKRTGYDLQWVQTGKLAMATRSLWLQRDGKLNLSIQCKTPDSHFPRSPVHGSRQHGQPEERSPTKDPFLSPTNPTFWKNTKLKVMGYFQDKNKRVFLLKFKWVPAESEQTTKISSN